MRVQLFVILSLLSISLRGQETYVKILDFFDGVDEAAPRNMFVIDDQIHILGRGACEPLPCLHYYVLSIEGEVLWTKRYPEISPALYCSLRDTSIYVAGRIIEDSLIVRDGFRVFELNTQGDYLGSSKYDQYALADPPGYDLTSYIPIGAIANEDKIVVYGDTRETDSIDDNFRRGLLMYYNKDMSFDTLVFINPSYRDTEMWNADLDSESNFVFLFDYDEYENGGDVDYRTVARYDSHGNLLFRWEPPELFGETEAFISFDVLSSDNFVFELEHGGSPGDTSNDLMQVDNQGNTIWRKYLDFASVNFGVLKIKEAMNNSLLIAGFSNNPNFRGAHISMYDIDSGEIVWDRVYLDWVSEVFESAHSTFYNVQELSDGSIVVAGLRPDDKWIDSLTRTSQKDLYLLRLDSEGCVEPGCGGLEQHIAGEPEYVPLTNFSQWHLQKYATPHGVFKQAYKQVPTLELTYKENRSEEILGIGDAGWPSRSSKLLVLKEEGKKVYYIEDYDISQEEVLLYDFTLEVGDLFSSDYLSQTLEVIESDTMRLSDRSKMRYWVLACTENPEYTITWMERIGTYHGVVWPSDFCSGDYGDETLTCYYKHLRFAHMNPSVSDCLLPSSTDEQVMDALSEITAGPNPTSGFITISAPTDLQITRLELLDTKGVTHESFPVETSEVRMDLSGYPSGLYFVSVHTEQGSVVKKVVVNN